MAISTNGTVLARLAGALYNTQMSNATYSEVKTLDPATLADALYARDFSSSTDLAVATTLVTNLGLSSITGLNNWVAAQLTAAGSHKGAKIVDLLNGFAQMTADATYGAYATAFNATVDSALALSQTTGNAGGTFVAAGLPANASFTLTAGLDTFTGGAGNDTFNATGATWTGLDTLVGGAGADTLSIVDTTGGLAAGVPASATTSGIETINITSTGSVGAASSTGVAQINKLVVPALQSTTTAAVAQINSIVVPAGTSAHVVNFQYGTLTGNYTATGTASTSAAAFVSALNAAAGATVAVAATPISSVTGATTNGSTTVTSSAAFANVLVGQAISGTGIPSGAYVTAKASSSSITISAAATATGAPTDIATTTNVVLTAPTAGVALPAISFSSGASAVPADYPTVSLARANSAAVIASGAVAGDIVTVNYGNVSTTYAVGSDVGATAGNLVAALNAAAGATVAAQGSYSGTTFTAGTASTDSAVRVTAPTAGTALPAITFSGSAADVPTQSVLTANGAANGTAATFDVSSATNFAGLNTLTVAASQGASSIKVASTTDANITNTTAGVTLAGGKSQTVASKGTTALTGSVGAVNVTNNDTGSGTTSVKAGTNVVVTQKGTGAVTVGESAVGASNPTGTITVTTSKGASVQTYGGTDVTATVKGGAVTVGGTGVNDVAPTGAINVTSTSYNGAAVGAVAAYGGNGVTVTTGGGANVTVGAYATGANRVAAGAVSITDNNSSITGNTDAITVYGGTTVGITTTASTGAITVGASAALNTAGTGLDAATTAKTPSGNVTITNGTATKYGAATAASVYTNGATTVSVTGVAGTTTVADAQSTIATAGANVGKAIGASTLATVSLEGATGAANLTSDALVNVSISKTTLSGASADQVVTVYNNTAAHNVALTLNTAARNGTSSGYYYTQFVDDVATTNTVTTSGTASNYVKLSGAKLNTVTFSNTAPLTLAGLSMTAPVVASGSVAAIDDTIVANGSGALTLGDRSGAVYSTTGFLKSINASGATGAVSVTLDASKTIFTGGSANDVVTIKTGSGITKAISGGSGTNTLIVDASSSGDLSGSSYISNFQNLGMGASAAGTFDATGFTNVSTGGSSTGYIAGNSTFSNLATGSNLTIAKSTSAQNTTATGSGGASGQSKIITLSSANSNVRVGDDVYVSGSKVGTIATVTDSTHVVLGTAVGSALSSAAITFAHAMYSVTAGVTDASTGTADSLNLNLGTSGSSTTGANVGYSGYSTLVSASDVETININSTGVVSGTTRGVNYLALTDDALKTVTISGDNGLTLTQTVSSPVGVSTINASASTGGALDVTGVTLKTTGATITGGAGVLTAKGGVTTTATDVITTGSGGGVIQIGLAGSAPISTTYGSAWTAGSTTVNLGASSAVSDTIVVNNLVTSSHDPQSLISTVNGFVVASSGILGDKITFKEDGSAQGKTVLAATSATTAASGVESYTVANGIIKFTPVGVNSTASIATQLSDARAIVAAANSGLDTVAAFVYNGDSYVIQSGHIASSLVAEAVNVTKLSGITLSNIGNAAAEGSLVANSLVISATGTSDAAVATVSAAGVTTNTYDQTGFSGATHTTTGTTAAVTTTVTKDVGLSSYAEVTIGNSNGSGSTYTHSGSFEVAQNGSSGGNYLKVIAGLSSYDGTQVLDKLTVNGNWAVEFNTAALGSSKTLTVTNLVDATNTMSTVYLTGDHTAYLDQVSSTSLKTIDASAATGTVYVGRAVGTVNGPVANPGVTLKASQAATNAYLSGATDVVTLNSATTANVGGGTFALSGADSVVSATIAGTLQNALNIYASGTGANIDLSKVTAASSTVATIAGSSTSYGIGANATVKLGTGYDATYVNTLYAGTNTNAYLSNYNTVDVTKTAAAYGTTGGITTIQHGTTNSGTALTSWTSDKIVFNSVATIANVNVSAATSLAAALSTADAVAEGSGSSATQHALVWFQYGGDTYILQSENTGDQTSGVDTTDIVVKVVGINDVTSVSSGVVTIA